MGTPEEEHPGSRHGRCKGHGEGPCQGSWRDIRARVPHGAAQDGYESGPMQNYLLKIFFFAHQFFLVFVYLMCGPRQLFFFQSREAKRLGTPG